MPVDRVRPRPRRPTRSRDGSHESGLSGALRLIPSGGEPAARRHASDVLDRLAADPNDKFVMPSATAVRQPRFRQP